MHSLDYLLDVRRPARYIGAEFNSIRKEDTSEAIKFAICFPGLYEIGMSNLGLRIIYGLLNSKSDIVCERFFLPDVDMLALIQSQKVAMHSLESSRQLCEFDIIGFSLQHELDYTNVLHLLGAGKVPVFSRERSKEHPLVIAGGPALGNPETVADFFDCIVIGEAEEVLLELINEYKKSRTSDRHALLEQLAKIPGVYVPSLYSPVYADNGLFQGLKSLSENAPRFIQRRFIKDLDASYFPVGWMVPYINIIHDKILLELMRGCPHACHFCQARVIYSPFRVRSKERLIQLAILAQEKSGYEELSLLGLSSSDHPQIEDLVTFLIQKFSEQCVSLSLGSLRPSRRLSRLVRDIALIKKTGLTLAVESGSQRLRELINKKVDVPALKELIANCPQEGYRSLKLYFMYGLPFETKSDLEAIADLVLELSGVQPRISFTLSINPFIPKSHTVFQWHPMDKLDTLKEKQAFLKSAIRRKIRNIRIDFRSPEAAFLEGLLSRADRRISETIVEASQQGAILDAYGDYFNFSIWQELLVRNQIDVASYLYREIPRSENLIWDHIQMGLDKEALKEEYEKVLEKAANS